MKKSKRVEILITPKLWEELTKLSKDCDRSVSQIVREIIRKNIKDYK